MTTSSSITEKINSKCSQILPTNYHLSEKQYYGCVRIGPKNYYTLYFDDASEAALELRCLEKILSFEIIKTVEDEGFYPHRAILIEEKYQQSGRTNGLYTGLNMRDGEVPVDNPQ